MQEPFIRHSAVITSVHDGRLTVEIPAQEACGSCAAQKVCGSGDTKTFTLDDDGLDRKVGDNVTLCITRSMGYAAIAIAYLVPIFLVVFVLVLMNRFNVAEMTAAWIALGILALYFILIRLFGNKLKSQITITIE